MNVDYYTPNDGADDITSLPKKSRMEGNDYDRGVWCDYMCIVCLDKRFVCLVLSKD